MLYTLTILSILEVLAVVVPSLLVVAFVTVAERKTMASMQRRLGPNIVGYYGLLQAFADALKLLLKEYISPAQANIVLFFLGPIITLVFSLLGYLVIPFGPGLTLFDFSLGIFYMLAVSSISTYGILLAGWSANSKYAFLGSLRSTAQLISYELILSSAILLVVLLTNSLNLTVNVEAQRTVWFILPLLPIFIIFFIGAIAETNRAPFDLAEAESELVSGFMTEHSAVIFVFFFLAEYASIILICILTSLLFLGGYIIDANLLYDLYNTVLDLTTWLSNNYNIVNFDYIFQNWENYTYVVESVNNCVYIIENIDEGITSSLILSIKSLSMVFIFIWVRASFPRIRFDQLMTYCWTIMLPILFGFILFVPCFMYTFNMLPTNVLYG